KRAVEDAHHFAPKGGVGCEQRRKTPACIAGEPLLYLLRICAVIEVDRQTARPSLLKVPGISRLVHHRPPATGRVIIVDGRDLKRFEAVSGWKLDRVAHLFFETER